MAITKVEVTNMTDDTTGEKIPEGGGRTVRFGIGTPDKFTAYDIELTTANEKELTDFLSRFEAAGRVVKLGASKSTAKPGTTDADIRKWARGQGREVPARGKIPDEIRAAYKARNKAKNTTAGTPAEESQG
ncbi:Lsr2 family DNA-binding protein [Nocardia yunnanensis]|uniref:Lsr2 family DNA-binding protein n=1 Tax=Nocardia yunnanensis TaxID=2382165 RepID=UPI0013C4B72F|nr:histone-like nucleoid-structuring protein Lsr2 [Nocardia yunnanensis]